jgi:hypothetical protein
VVARYSTGSTPDFRSCLSGRTLANLEEQYEFEGICVRNNRTATLDRLQNMLSKEGGRKYVEEKGIQIRFSSKDLDERQTELKRR